MTREASKAGGRTRTGDLQFTNRRVTLQNKAFSESRDANADECSGTPTIDQWLAACPEAIPAAMAAGILAMINAAAAKPTDQKGGGK